MAETASEKIAREMVGRFPITHPNTPFTNVTEGSKPFDVAVEDIKVSLNKTAPDDQIGRLDVTVKVHSGSDLEGFKGSAYYRFLDEAGNVVYALLGDVHGVNGRQVPGFPSRVTKFETHFIPVDVLTAVHSVVPIPVRAEDDMLNNLKETVRKLAEGAEVVRDGLKKIGASLAEIIVALKVL